VQSDQRPASLDSQLDRLIATTEELLQRIKLIEQEHERNLRSRAELIENSLTAGPSKESYQPFIDEAARLAHERHDIATSIRPGLFRQVWKLFPALEIDYPAAYGTKGQYAELLQHVPEDEREDGWALDFLLGLASLLRNARTHLTSDTEAERMGHGEDSPQAIQTTGKNITARARGARSRSMHVPQAATKLTLFMEGRGLNPRLLSERMGKKVSDKAIRQLLNTGWAVPSVLADIASTMGIKPEELLSK
jgi:hypothetical protein